MSVATSSATHLPGATLRSSTRCSQTPRSASMPIRPASSPGSSCAPTAPKRRLLRTRSDGRSIASGRHAARPSAPRELGLSARQAGYPELAGALDRELERCSGDPTLEDPERPYRWRCRWARSRSESPHFVLRGHTGSVDAVAVGTLGGEQVIVSGGDDGYVRVWAADGSPRGDPLEGHTGRVGVVAVGTLGGEQVIVSGSDDGSVRVWAADGSPRGDPLEGHNGGVGAVAVGTLGGEQVIVSGGSDDGSVRVWAADGSPRGDPLTGHTGGVGAVAVGTLGGEQVIVSGGDDGTSVSGLPTARPAATPSKATPARSARSRWARSAASR